MAYWGRNVFPVALTVLLSFLAATCSGGTVQTTRLPAFSSGSANPIAPPSPTSFPISRGKVFPALGVEMAGEVIPIENGQRLSVKNTQRLPLRDGQVEVFVVPFPPSAKTDLHLFLFRAEAPVTGAEVEGVFDMPLFSHGRVQQMGREVETGHYAFSLDLLMYGEWVGDVVINHPNFYADFQVLLRFYP